MLSCNDPEHRYVKFRRNGNNKKVNLVIRGCLVPFTFHKELISVTTDRPFVATLNIGNFVIFYVCKGDYRVFELFADGTLVLLNKKEYLIVMSDCSFHELVGFKQAEIVPKGIDCNKLSYDRDKFEFFANGKLINPQRTNELVFFPKKGFTVAFFGSNPHFIALGTFVSPLVVIPRFNLDDLKKTEFEVTEAEEYVWETKDEDFFTTLKQAKTGTYVQTLTSFKPECVLSRFICSHDFEVAEGSYIVNAFLLQQFEWQRNMLQESGFDTEIGLWFHGIHSEGKATMESIARNGFLSKYASRNCLLGPGVYLTQSLQTAKKHCEFEKPSVGRNYLVLVLALKGNSLTVTKQDLKTTKKRLMRYNSIVLQDIACFEDRCVLPVAYICF